MTTKETLQAARKYIADPRKWTQGDLENPVGRVCAVGAIWKAKPGVNLSTDPAIIALASVLPQLEGVPTVSRITGYNDTHDHACVVAAFDAAIERAEP